jgi:hypothetical protein
MYLLLRIRCSQALRLVPSRNRWKPDVGGQHGVLQQILGVGAIASQAHRPAVERRPQRDDLTFESRGQLGVGCALWGSSRIRRPDKPFGPRHATGVADRFRGGRGVTACRSIRTVIAQIACAAGRFSNYDGHDQHTSSLEASRSDWDRLGTKVLVAHQDICDGAVSGISGF